MTTPARLPDGSTTPEGQGFAVDTVFGHRRIGHGGSINGFTAQLSWFPNDDLLVIVLSNSDRGSASLIATRIARVIVGSVEVEVGASDAAAISGTYAKEASPTKPAHEVTIRERRVLVRLPNGDVFHLVHLGGLVFTTDEDPTARITFEIGSDGIVTQRLDVQGHVIRSRRMR
jgi:hypothetical protein